MSAPLHPMPYADVNTVLHDFLARIRLILGERFRGMYLDGSLALGDFDPHSSDIDFVVTTDAQLSDGLFTALRDMHARFDASGSPWATEVEAVYIPQDALRRDDMAPTRVPRIERGGTLVKEQLDGSWIIHWYILREHGVVVAGPDPRPLIDPIEPHDLRRAMAALAESWLEPTRHDRLRLQHRGFQIYTVRNPLPDVVYPPVWRSRLQVGRCTLGAGDVGCALGRAHRARRGLAQRSQLSRDAER